MNRVEFMTELAILLQEIPAEERREAMQYYNDYFDDAGREEEEKIIKELGSPKKVAEEVKASLKNHDDMVYEYRETGYTDTRFESKEAPVKYGEGPKEDFEEQPQYTADNQNTYQYNGDEEIHLSKKGSKKGWKIFGIICAVIAALGLLLCVVGIVFGATWETVQEYAFTEEESYEESSMNSGEVSFSRIRRIDVEAEALDIRVMTLEGSEDEVKVTVRKGSDFVRSRADGEELNIELKDSWRTSDGTAVVIVYLPTAHFNEIDIDINAGNVYIETLSSVGSLSLSVDAGEILVDNFVADEVEMSCGAGSIVAEGRCNGNIEIECGAGDVEYTVKGSKSSYNYEIECGIGEVTVGDEKVSGFSEKKIRSQNAVKNMSIECGIGSVVVNFSE